MMFYLPVRARPRKNQDEDGGGHPQEEAGEDGGQIGKENMSHVIRKPDFCLCKKQKRRSAVQLLHS